VTGGCLNGFIDLFFRHGGRYYLLDWKSNRLEGNLANFFRNGCPPRWRRASISFNT
jgi:exodeoxyribonuclease V beta subunit